MKKRSQRCDINRRRPRHWHKYSNYKMYLSIMMVTYIEQHLSNFWSSIHEKVKQYWGWKSVAYKKRVYILFRITTI